MTTPTLLSMPQPVVVIRRNSCMATAEVDVDLWPGEIARCWQIGLRQDDVAERPLGRLVPDAGTVWSSQPSGRAARRACHASAGVTRCTRSDWGFVHQDPRQNLRMNVTAGGNIGERLMAQGARHCTETSGHRRSTGWPRS